MIDIQTETLYRFRDAVRFLPRRSRRAEAGIATLMRYSTEGINGIKLEYLLTGKAERSTSAEAIQRFFEAVTASQRGQIAMPEKELTESKRKQLEAARKRLREMRTCRQ